MTRTETAWQRCLRLSLVAVWLGTALVSVQQWQGQSLALVQRMGMAGADSSAALIGAGAALDALLGLALWLCPGRVVYALAALAMLIMTLVASVGLPDLWLHPLGPLLKNVPIAAILWLLWKDAT